jgi:hypothetical protein
MLQNVSHESRGIAARWHRPGELWRHVLRSRTFERGRTAGVQVPVQVRVVLLRQVQELHNHDDSQQMSLKRTAMTAVELHRPQTVAMASLLRHKTSLQRTRAIIICGSAENVSNRTVARTAIFGQFVLPCSVGYRAAHWRFRLDLMRATY